MGKTILIAGGSGLIGSAFREEAEGLGYTVLSLSRSSGPGKIQWDPSQKKINLDQPVTADAIINLAGSSIAGKRWTTSRKKEITRSRVDSSETIEAYLKNGLLTTGVYIGASGVGIYADHGSEKVDDYTVVKRTGTFMIDTVQQWEASHRRMETLGIRTVICRFGLVLSTKGGVLKEMMMPAAFGVLPYFGTGRQSWPWIHIQDVVALLLQAVSQSDMKGMYLVCAPGSVSQIEIMKAIQATLTPKRILLPVPAFALAIILGEMYHALLESCMGYPTRLLREGYAFRFPEIQGAMKNLLLKK